MLERTADPVEAIAESVGYEDASFFNRFFRRSVGLTPAQYRRRFGAMRKTLQQQTARLPPGGQPGAADAVSIRD